MKDINLKVGVAQSATPLECASEIVQLRTALDNLEKAVLLTIAAMRRKLDRLESDQFPRA